MTCVAACKVAGARAHCGACHRSFGSVSAFDAHRRGGTCVDPILLAMTEKAGVWRTPMSTEDAARLASLRQQPDDE